MFIEGNHFMLRIKKYIEYIKWQHYIVSPSHHSGKCLQSDQLVQVNSQWARETHLHLYEGVLGKVLFFLVEGKNLSNWTKTAPEQETVWPPSYINHHLQWRLCPAWTWKWLNFHRILTGENSLLEVLRPDWLKYCLLYIFLLFTWR